MLMVLARKWTPVMAAATVVSIIASSCTHSQPQPNATEHTALPKAALPYSPQGDAQIKPTGSQTQSNPPPHAVTSVTEAQRDFGEALLLKMSGSTADYDAAQTSAHQAFKGQNDDSYDLSRRTLTDDEWTILSGQRLLKTLKLAHTNLTDERLSRLTKLRDLKELDISKTQVTDKGISMLKSFQSLEKLSVEGIYLSDSSAQSLSTLTKLKDLDVTDTSMTDKGIAALTALTHLQRLRIARVNLSEAACRSIATLTQLQVLDLFRTNMNDSRLAIFAPLTHLTELRIKGAAITDVGLETIGHLPLLENVDLNDMPGIHDVGVQKLRRLKHLVWIGLGGTSITNKSLDVVGNFSTLVNLGVRNTAIDDNNLSALTSLKNLRRLFLQGSRVTAKGRKELQERMPNLQILF